MGFRTSLIVICALGGTAIADHHDVSGTSFDAPAEWQLQGGAADKATMLYKVNGAYAIAVVFPAQTSTADLAKAFAAAWPTVTSNTPTARVPKPSMRKIVGRSIAEGSMEVTSEGESVIADLVLLDAGGQVVPLLVYTQSGRMLKSLQGQLDKIVATIRVAPRTEAEPPAAPPAPVQAQATTGHDVALKSVALPDLVGLWDLTSGSTTDWFDSSTGNFKGTTVTFYGESHEIAADGSFKQRFVGRTNNSTVKESDSGTVSFVDGFLVLKYKNRRVDAVVEKRVMGFLTTPDGTSIMTTVAAHTTQTTVHWTDAAYINEFCIVHSGTPISCVGGETWVRKPKRR